MFRRIKELEMRVNDLEHKVMELKQPAIVPSLTKYSSGISSPYYRPEYEVSVDTAIMAILDHLKLEVKRTPAQPERTELVKEGKK